MVETIERLGTVIKEARNHADMTQRELAEHLHISSRYLMNIEHGRQKPSYDLLCSIISELDLQVDGVFHPEMSHLRVEHEEVVSLLHYLDDYEIAAICSALHTIIRFKKGITLVK